MPSTSNSGRRNTPYHPNSSVLDDDGGVDFADDPVDVFEALDLGVDLADRLTAAARLGTEREVRRRRLHVAVDSFERLSHETPIERVQYFDHSDLGSVDPGGSASEVTIRRSSRSRAAVAYIPLNSG
ncbi:MAG: hypothetical protein ABEJ28_03600 [Salinigranum sp.]